MQTFVISLANAYERRAFQQAQLYNLGISFHFIDAVSAEYLSNHDLTIALNRWERPLMPTEVACFFSHYNLWLRIAKSDEPALILEDDAILADQLPLFLTHLQNTQGIEHLSLETRLRKKLIGLPQHLSNDLSIAPLYQDRTGAAAYILWPKGAQKLIIKAKQQGAALADAFISNNYQLHSWQVLPALALQADVAEHYNVLSTLKTHSYIQANDCKANYAAKGLQGMRYKLRRLQGQLRLACRLLSRITHARHILVPMGMCSLQSRPSR